MCTRLSPNCIQYHTVDASPGQSSVATAPASRPRQRLLSWLTSRMQIGAPGPLLHRWARVTAAAVGLGAAFLVGLGVEWRPATAEAVGVGVVVLPGVPCASGTAEAGTVASSES